MDDFVEPLDASLTTPQAGSIGNNSGSLDGKKQERRETDAYKIKKMDREILTKVLYWSFLTWCVLSGISLIWNIVVFQTTGEIIKFTDTIKECAGLISPIITLSIGYIVGSKK